MKEDNGKGGGGPASRLGSRLRRAIWCFGGVSLGGIIFGAAVSARIYHISGWGRGPGSPAPDRDKYVTGVLITVQNRPLGGGDGTDMVFTASFNGLDQRLTVAALSGDLLLGGKDGGRSTLRELYAAGGPELLAEELGRGLGIGLPYYVSTNTYALSAIIDLMGGVNVRLSPGEADYITRALGTGGRPRPGENLLSGREAMVYAMDGVSGGAPLGELERRLKLVRSAVSGMRESATRETMLPLLSLVFSNVETNLDFAELHDLGYDILKAEDMDYRDMVLPVKGSWSASERGLEADVEKNGELLRGAM